jgi:NADPH:quinone reductase-like Zn-dependent oxidoreductase
MAMQYQKIVISRYGGPEVLEVVSEELREAQPGEVRVRVLAAGVSWVEYMLRHGTYPHQPKPPLTPGYDVVGVVDQNGAGATRFKEGQMVAALTCLGGYSQYVYLPEAELVAVPAGVDPAAAVCLVLNYVTAYQMLHREVRVERGGRLLVHSAAGGVGTAALDLGRLAGLEMLGTASPAKLQLVEKLGARAIDYQREDFVARVSELPRGGVDLVLDSIGGSHWLRSRRCLRRGGTLIAYGSQGSLAGGRRSVARTLEDYAVGALLMALPLGRRFAFYSITAMKARHPDWFQEDLSELFRLLAAGQIQPVIAQRLPWTEARRANELLEQGAVQGKLVLVF